MPDLLTLSLFLIIATLPLGAISLGVHGRQFPIEEQDLILYLEKRISSLSLEEREKALLQVEQHYRKAIEQPSGASLKSAKFYEVRYFDPTVYAHEDFEDQEGNIIVPKGTLYNPLSQYELQEELLFFDGNNLDQIAWAKDQEADAKWILVNGNPLALEESEARPVYFDQYGAIVKKLSIESIPARVSQEGIRLKVEMIPMEAPCCS